MSYPMTQDPRRAAELVAKSDLLNASDLQIAIFDHIDTNIRALRSKNGPTNLLVQAVAGSGKTTTIVAAARLIPARLKALFLAFNKRIADELASKLPEGVRAMTLNKLGYVIIGKYLKDQGLRWPDVEENKVWRIIRRLYTKPEVKNYGADVNWLVGMCKSLGIVPTSVAEDMELVNIGEYDDSDDSFIDIIDHFDHHIDLEHQRTVFRMAREVLATSCSELGTVDFNDQKYLPVVLRPAGRPLAAFAYAVVMVDEVQDVNAVDIALIDLVTTRVQVNAQRFCGVSMVIGVGDDNQAIYGFRGADTEAVARFKAHFGCEELPLSMTFRCGAAIVRSAQEIYPTIQAAPNAIEGEVHQNLGAYDHTLFQPDTDMIVCRNNAPTITLAYRLIARKVPVFVAGRDIGRGLLNVIERLEAVNTLDLTEKLNEWYDKQKLVILKANPDDEAGVERLNDRYSTLMVFVKANIDGRVESIVRDIQELFQTESKGDEDAHNERASRGKVVLSSMHKAKGLEADRVFILDYGLMYRFSVPGTWQHKQEKNLDYVARTRAKSYMAWIDSKGWKQAA